LRADTFAAPGAVLVLTAVGAFAFRETRERLVEGPVETGATAESPGTALFAIISAQTTFRLAFVKRGDAECKCRSIIARFHPSCP